MPGTWFDKEIFKSFFMGYFKTWVLVKRAKEKYSIIYENVIQPSYSVVREISLIAVVLFHWSIEFFLSAFSS